MSQKSTVDPWTKAIRHLKKVDPHLKQIIGRVGPCSLSPREDRFGALVGAIVSQQISTKAAASISERISELVGRPYDPHRLLELGEDPLRACGLSGSKARYVLNLAAAVVEGATPVDQFDKGWNDDAIIDALTTVKGIGVWTAHMFLIFALNRPDVLPAGDLGVRVALRDRHGLAELPGPLDCHALTEHWRPYRSVGSWYLWRSLDVR
ncbi:DNA-3-methyladenine glycosylase family protein [Planctomyces sp. SH-PL62]|uniref:DNA-3-methyladenine glycosylase family protein n=1 Tax=Planctomyces sp. SH-PL62 TaxID=1636152 RepID=UPI00078DA410|nr:DNA-3-methyladenine glycosylase [Planctomyces sp. SH-PL62]AMV39084.1 DNA-3-methyladenine glycosylase [Planctomyces sp. SH-PL62]